MPAVYRQTFLPDGPTCIFTHNVAIDDLPWGRDCVLRETDGSGPRCGDDLPAGRLPRSSEEPLPGPTRGVQPLTARPGLRLPRPLRAIESASLDPHV